MIETITTAFVSLKKKKKRKGRRGEDLFIRLGQPVIVIWFASPASVPFYPKRWAFSDASLGEYVKVGRGRNQLCPWSFQAVSWIKILKA